MLNLRNSHIACHYICSPSVTFHQAWCRLTNIRKACVALSIFKGRMPYLPCYFFHSPLPFSLCPLSISFWGYFPFNPARLQQLSQVLLSLSIVPCPAVPVSLEPLFRAVGRSLKRGGGSSFIVKLKQIGGLLLSYFFHVWKRLTSRWL